VLKRWKRKTTVSKVSKKWVPIRRAYIITATMSISTFVLSNVTTTNKDIAPMADPESFLPFQWTALNRPITSCLIFCISSASSNNYEASIVITVIKMIVFFSFYFISPHIRMHTIDRPSYFFTYNRSLNYIYFYRFYKLHYEIDWLIITYFYIMLTTVLLLVIFKLYYQY